MKLCLNLAIAILAAGCGLARAESLNGLYSYLQYQVIARNFAPNYWYFLPDGRYLNAVPMGEASPQALEQTCAKWADACGTYVLAADHLTLSPRKGKPWTAPFKHLPGGKLEINTVACQKVTAQYAVNARLNGRYTAGSGSAGILSAKTLVFQTDGTFTTKSIGSIRSAAGSAISSSAGRGAYRLSGNTLEMTLAGHTTKHLIHEVSPGSDSHLLIDGQVWKKSL